MLLFEPISLDELKNKLWGAVRSNTTLLNHVTDQDRKSLLSGDKIALEDAICAMFQLEDFSDKVNSDISKVVFDFENCMAVEPEPFKGENPVDVDSNYRKFVGFHVLPNGMPFLGIVASGDWEKDVYFIIYWSGTELRAYIPVEGNSYNLETNTAYGSEELAGFGDYPEYNPYDENDQSREPNEDMMLAEIQDKITSTRGNSE